MRPTNLNAFKLPSHRIERTVDALVDWIERHWSMLAACAIFAIYAGVSDSEYQELAAADKRAVEDARAQRDEAQLWASGNKVRLVMEGDGPTVRALAGQMAVLAK